MCAVLKMYTERERETQRNSRSRLCIILSYRRVVFVVVFDCRRRRRHRFVIVKYILFIRCAERSKCFISFSMHNRAELSRLVYICYTSDVVIRI